MKPRWITTKASEVPLLPPHLPPKRFAAVLAVSLALVVPASFRRKILIKFLYAVIAVVSDLLVRFR